MPGLAPRTPPARRGRARSCAGPRLFVAAGDAPAPRASRYIEPHESPLAINGHPCRLLSWTAEEWSDLGAMQPAGTMLLAGGVRSLLVAD